MSESHIKVDLPGGSLYESSSVNIRPFTFRNQRRLYTIKKTNDTQGIYTLIAATCKSDISELAMPDFKFLMHWHRINSYPGHPRNVPWDCPHCQTRNLSTVTAEDLTVTDAPEDLKHEGMMIEWPGLGVRPIRFQRVGDEAVAREYLMQERVQITDEAIDEILLALVTRKPDEELFLSVRNVRDNGTADDAILYEEFRKEYDYGVHEVYQFDCDVCKEVTSVRAPMSLVDFFPVNDSPGSVRSRILHASSPESADGHDGGSGLRQDPVHSEEARRVPQEAGPEASADEVPPETSSPSEGVTAQEHAIAHDQDNPTSETVNYGE